MIMPPRSRTALDQIGPPSVPVPTTTSHGTQVEQSRAVAQVEAAVISAKRFPRDEAAAQLRMRAATDRVELSRVAFYRYPRGGQTITDLTIHVARELARVWGNIDYGLVEISRDLAMQQSEMLAYAWDMETNTRSATTFIVPWIRDANGRLVPLDNPRDVYENNANVGARRVREQIKAVMPGWLFDEAKERLKNTIKRQRQDIPIETQRVNSIEAFGKFGVIRKQLEDKLGRKADEWTDTDVFDLGVIHDSLVRRETTVEEEFGARPSRSRAALDAQPDRAAEEAEERQTLPPSAPAERVSGPDPADPWQQQAGVAVAAGLVTHEDVATPPAPGVMTEATARAVAGWFERHGLTGEGKVRTERRNWIARSVLGTPDLAGIGELDDAQGRELVSRLNALSAAELAQFGLGGPEGQR